ncbi:hypothetical protein ACOZ35_03065 [Halorubrum xinjiangense]|uniref:hypothetical protein n=1 Tax=Halorubrum xinjiangense TaxID=261291 RepID=UPI003C6EDF26
MRSDPTARPTKLTVLATLAAVIAALAALAALGAVGVVAESPSQTADADPIFGVEITDYDAAVTEDSAGSDDSADSEDSADSDDDDSGSAWSLPTYVEKRDPEAVDGDGVVELPGNSGLGIVSVGGPFACPAPRRE